MNLSVLVALRQFFTQNAININYLFPTGISYQHEVISFWNKMIYFA